MKQFSPNLMFLAIFMVSFSFAQTARVQIIHNSADLEATEVDVYLNDVLLIDDFTFRTATAFQDIDAGTINVRVAPEDSSSSADFLYEFHANLVADETYILIANGIISSSGYTKNNNFSIKVFNMARETSNQSGNTDFIVHHGSIDAEAIDVNGVGGSSSLLVNNLAYSEFSNGYISLFSNTYTINFTAEEDGQVLSEYTIPFFPTYNNEAITLVASGFFDPSVNSNGPAFGLWVATADGGPLTEIQPNALSVENTNKINVEVYPNPVSDFLYVNFKNDNQAQLSLFDLSGREVMVKALGMKNQIDLSNFSNGLYLLNLSDRYGSKSMKIEINN